MTGTYRAILVRDDVADAVEAVTRDLEDGESETDREIDDLEQYTVDVAEPGDNREISDRPTNANGDDAVGNSGRDAVTPTGGRR